MADGGRVEALWLKRAHRAPMDAVRRAQLVTGKGLAGNVDRSRFRQVTLLERELWERVAESLGADIDPSARRANVLLSGIALARTRGRLLRIGDTLLRIGGEVRPCERLEAAFPGLREALRPDWGGGAFAQVERGGEIAVGDEVAWEREQGEMFG